MVVDFTNGAATSLPADSVRISGKQVKVVVDPSLPPTPPGGVPPAPSTFNLWPRSSLSMAPLPDLGSFVAGFIPEDAMAPIRLPDGHDD